MELLILALVVAFFFLYRSSKKSKPAAPKTHRTEHETQSNTPQDGNDSAYRFIAIDVETANKNPASICQIGLAYVDHENRITVESFYVNPKSRFNPSFTGIHGITQDMVKNERTFAECYPNLRDKLEHTPLVQHSNFDKAAIDAACDRDELPKLAGTWFDSVIIARKAWPELRAKGGHGLANLKKALKLKFKHHDAGEDARAAAEIVLMAESVTNSKFEQLARPTRQAKKFQPSIAIEGKEDGAFHGEVACFTGQLSLTREDAARHAASAGITVKTTMSRKVTMLIVGDQDLASLAGHAKSSKHRKAEEMIAGGHELRIIGETEFLDLVRSGRPN